ncbi:HEAT repeat domain-containing protein [Haloarchaeobius sp. DYHT-AS-18]|uniref:HEAT repeat domain-containing protein n=1 Tax=Haloarchaeobius sp. DYHT-AS-18 TaxID=3446117 RepID=UPI003EBB7DC2
MSREQASAGRRRPAADEPGLRQALGAAEPRTRQDAAIALVDRAGDGLAAATVDRLAARAREDDDPEVRQFAVEALGVAGTGTETLSAALEDPEPWVRAEAVVALSRAGRSDEQLRSALDDENGWVRRNAVIALGKRGAIGHQSAVDRIKTDPHPAVREYAAQYLGEVVEDVEEAERILAAVLAREPNAFVRAKAAESLGELGTDRAEQALETHGVTDQSEDVARTATRALAAARGTEPEELDVDIESPGAPGRGPDTPADQSVDRFDPAGSFGSSRTGSQGAAPGGAPGFEPRRDLNTNPDPDL